ncbi:hypothetical protein [Actinoplanes sp. URMC 104]|uniref:hypothetical protein n=1 Tax=Actinoplanes sp. URMC 104 TaxID=3423409 RepID=UPI003F1B9916
MSEHTPTSHPATTDPTDRPAIDTAQTDLVAGDPPVPITVWRTARTEADADRGIGARLAARLIAAYSRPGEIVVDLTDGHVLTHVCGIGGREHHPAWFADADSMIIGPASPLPADDGPLETTDDRQDPPELTAWFGNDLTDQALHPAGTPIDMRADGSLHGVTSLVVACWPLDTTGAAGNRVRLGWLLTACAQLLRPGGCLLLVVAAATGTRSAPEDFSDVVQAAAGMRLGYLQHIVAVAADTDGDAFIYHLSTDEELLALTGATGDWQATHLRVHADLLVFSQIPQPTTGRGNHSGIQHGGGHRG